MDNLALLINESERFLVNLDNSDLPALGALHETFLQIIRHISQTESEPPDCLRYLQSTSQKTADIVEKIVLREIEDANQATHAILQAIHGMKDIIDALARGLDPKKIVLPPECGYANAAINDDLPAAPKVRLPDNVDEDIFREFITNQPDVLANLEAAILEAEKNPNVENRNAVKRILHTLKGEAGLMGLEDIAGYCHDIETVLEESNDIFPAEKLFEAKDWLQNAVGQFAVYNNGAAVNSNTSPKITVPAAKVKEPIAEIPAQSVPAEELRVAQGDIPLVCDFIQESGEHLDSAEANLLTIEENPQDSDAVNAIFRAFHTIKGVAGFLNLKDIGSLAHVTENLLDLARKGTLTISGASTDVIFEAIDMMKQMLGGLKDAIENNKAISTVPKLISVIDRIKSCSKGDTPPPRIGEILVKEGAVNRSVIREALVEQDRSETPKQLGEILIEKYVVTPEQVEAAAQNQKTAQVSQPSVDNKKVTAETTVKVTTERLDSLINMVGELVIAQSMVSQDLGKHTYGNQRLERNARHLNKITRELQELSMSMRMVPVQGVFQKMARLVRDLSRKAGKDIEFVMKGADTELDRNVVEAIADPLVHMVRNSIDHGVEPPDEREKAGKSRCGKVELKAYHQGGNIIIEISDDGRGLNRDKILKKAIAQGLVKDDQVLSDPEIYRLIFHAGLSTAEKITDISGRGVGMDVVRKNIEALRGRVDIVSELGRGSSFSIRLPLTLSVIDGQTITVGKEKYIIPTLSIEQSLRPAKDQLATVQGQRGEMMNIRGSLLPLARLHQLFQIQSKSTDPAESLVVVVTDGNKRCCLLVDELLGQQQVVIKNLGDYLGKIKGVSGGAIMGDGNVSLILDIPTLINLAQHN
jgi:two-component system, chemotaxis family, sensor kinase CheA